jgi:hypothetical protein
MSTIRSCCILVANLIAFSALACENPAVVMIPDGARASTAELLEVQARVHAYLAAMDEYLACLDEQIQTAGNGDGGSPEYMSLMIARYNTAVEEMETVAASFNEQVRAHNAANAAEPSN